MKHFLKELYQTRMTEITKNEIIFFKKLKDKKNK